MKISIKNFGPIDHFEFDLEKDLHVIYGENNIGKSWAIEGLYLLLKFWREEADSFIKYSKDERSNKDIPNDMIFDFLFVESDLNDLFSSTFGEMKSVFSYLQPLLKFETDVLEVKLERDNGYKTEERDYPEQFRLISVFGENLIKNKPNANFQKFENLYFLPASKSGIYQVLSNMGNIFAQLSQLPLKNTSLNLPSMSIPVSDYILNIAAINSSKQGEFGNFVNFLEEKIIEGSVVFDDFQKKLKYKSNRTGLVSELHEASSMIAEISPLVAYLKYILPKKNSILFIEEPEAHLHPKVQVEMMKVFVDLAKSGVKVVMTTHSDFMMNELSNLLLAKEIDAEKVASYHLKMGEKGSFDAGDMKATSEGIEDYNFTDVAIKQYERRIEILEKLNQDAVRQD
jgi:predicted ATPase